MKNPQIRNTDIISSIANMVLLFFFAAMTVLLHIRWYVLLSIGLVGMVILIVVLRRMSDYKVSSLLSKKMKRVHQKAKRQGNYSLIYTALDKEWLPAARADLPKSIFKYFPLEKDLVKDKKTMECIDNNELWTSLYSGFNDPFECQYAYITTEDVRQMGFPEETKKIWDACVSEIKNRITTTCFTQNPNSMPMWAHYANEHRGFCVEYTVISTKNLYPIIYVPNRLKAQNFFVELIYAIVCKEATIKDMAIIIKHFMLLSAFKDESWESEKEVRAILLNQNLDITKKGKVFSCDNIGIAPAKIYVGVNCSNSNREQLISIAKELGIPCEECSLSTNEAFSVTDY